MTERKVGDMRCRVRWVLVLALACLLASSAVFAADESPAAGSPGPQESAVAPQADDAQSGDRVADPPADAADEPPADERVWYDSVTVTAARTAIDRVDVPANVSVLGQTEVRESAAVTIDGVLRQVPGFATLREQSSVVSPPQ
jgi:outer membrane receptor for Fe3+-dicitrate